MIRLFSGNFFELPYSWHKQKGHEPYAKKNHRNGRHNL